MCLNIPLVGVYMHAVFVGEGGCVMVSVLWLGKEGCGGKMVKE
jgi:hypothetical protein